MAEFAETLTLITKTKIGKSRNSACSCSDNVITATPYGEMETVFYDYKVNPRLLQEGKTIPHAAAQCVAESNSTLVWMHPLHVYSGELNKRRDLIFHPCSGLIFQKEYKAFNSFWV